MAHVLMLTPQLPYPPHQGTSLRNFHMLKALAERHQVTLLSLAEGDRPQEIEPLRPYCRVLMPITVPLRSGRDRLVQLITSGLPDVALRLRSDTFSAALVSALTSDTFDAVQIEGIELAAYIQDVRMASPSSKVVLDCHNAETELQRRALRADLPNPSRWLAAAYSVIQVGRLAQFEKWALRQADSVIGVSDPDRIRLKELAGNLSAEIHVVPNTIAVAEYESPESLNSDLSYDLVFTGKMDYRPNVDGVLWFAESVWPEIRRRRPHTTWAIVGQRPHKRLEVLREMSGVTLTGRVEIIQPYIAGGLVYIMPLRIGSGTRLKLIEAMAAGKPVVSTRIGAEGFNLTDGEQIALAETIEEWVEAILRLLDDPRLREEMGAAARQYAARYDWRQIIPTVNKIYDDLTTE